MNSPSERVFEPRLLDGQTLAIADVVSIACGGQPAGLDQAVLGRLAAGRAGLEALAEQGLPIYGVNTGFGEMVHNWVESKDTRALQENLLRSHCAGVGETFAREEARAMMVARVNSLARGYSAIRPEVVMRLVEFLNRDITPAIPQIGSLGASGDLAPLAAMAITLIGEGYVLGDDGVRLPAARALGANGLAPLALRGKEALSLINGTSAMTGLACLVLAQFRTQIMQAEVIAALALEALQASTGAFAAAGHELAKPHPGQVASAANLRRLTADSGLAPSHESLSRAMREQASGGKAGTGVFLQKAYSLRCIPQVLGAVRDTLSFCTGVVERELNSSNDNPLYFGGEDLFHGGNFHGQHVAFAMDYLAIAATQLGVLSERRLNRLLSPHLNGPLPAFLSRDPGPRCGFAGAQYPATALVAENRALCSAASIQSVPANGDNQDVVSMGLIAARTAKRIVQNASYILAIELLAACQAIDLSTRASELSPAGRAVHSFVRDQIPALDHDRFMSDDIELTADFLRKGALLSVVEQIGIPLQ
ncbi:MAG: tyrosine 2,3-aminomutase [Burkholderiales bacterium]